MAPNPFSRLSVLGQAVAQLTCVPPDKPDRYIFCREAALAVDLVKIVPPMPPLLGSVPAYDQYAERVCRANAHTHSLDAAAIRDCIGRLHRKCIKALHAHWHACQDPSANGAAPHAPDAPGAAGAAAQRRSKHPHGTSLEASDTESGVFFPLRATAVPQMPLALEVSGDANHA